MYHPNTPSLARAYQEMLLEEAKQSEYTVRVAKTTAPPLQERVFVSAGDALISLGRRLRARYEEPLVCGPEVYPSTAGKARA